MRCLWLVWSLLAWLAAILCTIGCLLPYWLRGHVYIPSTFTPSQNAQPIDLSSHSSTDRAVIDLKSIFPTDLGLFRRCGFPVYTPNHTDSAVTHRPISWHSGCGHYSHVTNVPHSAWRIAFFTLVSACVLLFFTTFFLSMLGFALYLISSRRVYRSCQVLLLLSGALAVLSCILYPVGWSDNPEIEHACGPDAGLFQPGRCHVGWAYVLTCSGGLLSLFASVLPIIFPKSGVQPHNKRTAITISKNGGPSHGIVCCCFPALKTGSAQGKSLDMFPLSGPSPANSAQGVGSLASISASQHLDNRVMFFQTRADSPNGSSSPAGSLLCEQPNPTEIDSQHRAVSTGVRPPRPPSAMFTPVGLNQTAYAPYVCAYGPPRAYSSELLVSQSVHGVPLSQRVSVAVNPDPLIYVAEEDEMGEKVENAYEKQVDEKAVDGDPLIAANSDQSNVPNGPKSSSLQPTDVLNHGHQDVVDSSHPARRIQSTMNVAHGNVGQHHQYVMIPTMQPVLMPALRWFSPYQYVPVPPGSALLTSPNSSTSRSEVIRRKRSSCML